MMRARQFAVIAALVGCVGAALAQSETTRELHKVYPLAKDGRVKIDTYKGSITVTTWDKAEAEVHVRIEADGSRQRDEQNVALTEIEMRSSAKELRIESDYRKIRSRGFFGDDGNLPLVHYTLTMPATAELEIEDYKSASSIRELKADLRFETYKGTLDAEGLAGAVKLETYKGDIDVAFATLQGDCRMETYKGTIRIRIPKGAGFEINAEIGRRADLESDFSLSGLREGGNRDDKEYRGPVNGGGPEIRLETYKGKYSLVAAEK